jgi:putative ABC transport system permease protein
MYKIALKMLIEDKAKFIGMVLSLSFSAIIITQQSAIFSGVMKRTYSTITDTAVADIWVMDPNVKYIDDLLPLRNTDLYRVRSVDGVKWAVPFFKGMIRGRMTTGQFQTCILIGIDDSTLIGAPHTMLEGRIEDLRGPDAVIVNKVGAEDKLARSQGPNLPKIPLHVGDQIELNDQRANVIGICDVTRTFQEQPVIYTTYNRALHFSPFERKLLSFILVKSDGKIPTIDLCKKISQTTHFAAYPKEKFESITMDYYLKNTGIPLNFGIAVLLGLLVGAVIAGQIFYNFISDNLKYLALFLVMGAPRSLLVQLSLIQALWVGMLGWTIGSGCSALIGFLTRDSKLSYHLSWSLFLGTGVVIICICIFALLISMARIFKIELASVFK